MTLLQRLRGILTTTQKTYTQTTAEQLCTAWDGATIRDPVFRADMTRRSVRQDHAAVSCLWRFEDGSVLVANDQEIFCAVIDNPVVGHKTTADGSHAPLRKSEADVIMAQVEEADARRIALMPDENAAIHILFDAWQRLKDLGWREAQYCPKDGSSFQVIEAGSTGIFRAHYHGEWPKGYWWLEDGGDLYPSHPILHRLYPEDEANRKARMEAARERYRPDRVDQ